ncbi:MAG: GNAT family N-acetyltransferase [Anaerolineales bacterium]|nr:GNAT family N-acetyltransferase [Anaerolineales bacterium]
MTICEIRVKKVLHATLGQVGILTQIAFAAKRHWGYPERWIQIWSPLLTISPEFIESHDTYVAYVGEEPVGFCAISVEGERASVEHLWVLPGNIGMGIGAALFKHMISRCKDLGVRVLEIVSDPNALGFYEHMGAKVVGEHVGEVEGQLRILPVLEMTLAR